MSASGECNCSRCCVGNSSGGVCTPLPKTMAAELELTSLSTAESSRVSTSWSPLCGRCTATSWNNSAHTHTHTLCQTSACYTFLPSDLLPKFYFTHVKAPMRMILYFLWPATSSGSRKKKRQLCMCIPQCTSWSDLLTLKWMGWKNGLQQFSPGLSNLSTNKYIFYI